MSQSLKLQKKSNPSVEPFLQKAVTQPEAGKGAGLVDGLVLVKQAFAAMTQRDFATAAHIYSRLLHADLSNAGIWHNLSIALREQGHRATSLCCAKRAIALSPSNLNYLINVSDGLIQLDRLDEALNLLSEVVQQEPDNVLYRRKYADALRQSHRFEEALVQINIACEMQPDDVEANWQRTVIHLALGQLSAGWKNYDLRRKRGRIKEGAYSAPQWTGQDLKGKTILLYEEQGFGDTILTSRYIPLVKQRGARVLLGCKEVLHKLFETIPGIDRFCESGAAIGESFDYHASLLSLPGIFGTELDTIPPTAKLCPAENPPPAASRLLQLGKDRLKVGVIWSGSPDFGDNYKRAVSFSRFIPLAGISGVQLYSLQMGDAQKELAQAGAEGLVFELGPHLKTFADTAAVLEELDLVIMTDSSVAHLAGSLERPIWNLLNFDPYWLYMMDRSDSPWYPSMRLFRQPSPGDWDRVFKEVTIELEKAVAARVDYLKTLRRH